jgi:hypothetical protein
MQSSADMLYMYHEISGWWIVFLSYMQGNFTVNSGSKQINVIY